MLHGEVEMTSPSSRLLPYQGSGHNDLGRRPGWNRSRGQARGPLRAEPERRDFLSASARSWPSSPANQNGAPGAPGWNFDT